MSKQENKNRLKLVYLLIISIIIFGWVFINSYYDFGTGAVQYTFLSILSILGLIFLPKLGIDGIFGIDKNWKTDILIGIAMGIGLIILSIFSLVGSFVYGASLFSIRVFGAGVVETVFFGILIIPLVYKLFRDKKSLFNYFIVCLVVGGIFSFFHIAVVLQGSSNPTLNYGFFISAAIIFIFWGFVLRWTESALPLIISHMMLNFWILNQTEKWINFGTNMIIPLIHNILTIT